MNKEKEICGKTETIIRKAYFEKKIVELLNEIQGSKKYDKEEIEKLSIYLGELKEEDKNFLDKIVDKLGGEIIKKDSPPSVEELHKGISDASWREKADKAILYIENTLDKIRENIANKKSFSSNFWSDTSIVFISMTSVIDRDLIFKRQLFKAKLTTIIDDFGTSRKEAEERAELTKEYFDYKSLDKLAKRLDEFYTFARRRDDENNHR